MSWCGSVNACALPKCGAHGDARDSDGPLCAGTASARTRSRPARTRRRALPAMGVPRLAGDSGAPDHALLTVATLTYLCRAASGVEATARRRHPIASRARRRPPVEDQQLRVSHRHHTHISSHRGYRRQASVSAFSPHDVAAPGCVAVEQCPLLWTPDQSPGTPDRVPCGTLPSPPVGPLTQARAPHRRTCRAKRHRNSPNTHISSSETGVSERHWRQGRTGAADTELSASAVRWILLSTGLPRLEQRTLTKRTG